MLTSKEDIENDINETLEQLTQNSAALKMAKASHHFAHEVEQLEKMQESLLARLMHRQSLLEMDMREKKIASIPKQAIEEKVVEIGKLIHRNNYKNREYDKEAAENSCRTQATIALGQGASEDRNSKTTLTPSETASYSCFGAGQKSARSRKARSKS